MILAAPTPLNFIHVAKCGGTSLRIILDNLFNDSDIYPYIRTSEIDPNRKVDPYNYKLVRGHLGIIPWQSGEVPDTTFTWLRDPKERLVSAFHFRKQKLRLPRETTLQQWLKETDPNKLDTSLIRWILYGAMFRNVSHYTDEQTRIANRIRSNDPALADEACDVLDRCFMVGLQEEFQNSLNILHYHLGSYPTNAVPFANKTLSRTTYEELGSEDQAIVDQHTRLDQKVYLHGAKIFRRNLRRLKNQLSEKFGVEDKSPQEVNEFLRYEFFAAQRSIPLANSIHYTFDRKLIGSGWHVRQSDSTNSSKLGTWRWIDPEYGGEIYLPIQRDQSLSVFLGISHLKASQFLSDIRLFIDDDEISLQPCTEVSHPYLANRAIIRGRIDPNRRVSKNVLTRLLIECRSYYQATEIEEQAKDARKLNVALNWISVQPVEHKSVLIEAS